MTLLAASESELSPRTGDHISTWSFGNPTTGAQFQQHQTRVLLIEHNDQTANAVAAALDSSGYESLRCRTAKTALAELKETDIVLLNLELPEVDGLSFLAEIRLATQAPMLVYSRRQDVGSVVIALQCGADDYMVEPVRPLELLARVKAISRRAAAASPPEQIVQVGDMEVRLVARTVAVGGEFVRFTPREFDVLAVLARNAGQPVSRRDIMHEVWGRSSLPISRTLDVHMTALRTKLGRPNLLLTVRGFGYRLGSSTKR